MTQRAIESNAYIIMVDFETILQTFLFFDEIVAYRIAGVRFAMSASPRTTLGIIVILFTYTEEKWETSIKITVVEHHISQKINSLLFSANGQKYMLKRH